MRLKAKYLTNLVTNTSLKAEINEVKGKIPNITNLATTTALPVAENKIPNVSNLVKKSGYNTKINEIENEITTDHDHDKYITTQEFNKLTAQDFASRLAQANLESNNDIAKFVKKTDFDNKLRKLNKNFTSDKTCTCWKYIKWSEKVKAISTKGSKKDLINKPAEKIH